MQTFQSARNISVDTEVFRSGIGRTFSYLGSPSNVQKLHTSRLGGPADLRNITVPCYKFCPFIDGFSIPECLEELRELKVV